jgi:penicillin amidase
VIPYADVPQVYDPPGHVIVTANQRPVSSSYPYYIGTSADFFDPGYRAEEIYRYLRGHSAMTAEDFGSLQSSFTDSLANTIVPKLLATIRTDTSLNATGQAAMRLLTRWNDVMNADSAAAAIWFTFWSDYVSTVFEAWWKAAQVPVAKDPTGLQANWQQVALDEDLEAWTLTDPSAPAFTPPSGVRRTSAQVMRSAFATAVAQLSAKFGNSPSSWTWGRLHSTEFASVTGAPGLGYGPQPSGGDQWTVNAADGYPVSNQGPSWRMVVKWEGRGQSMAEAIYPGGQSENPASPWYTDLIASWWQGSYLSMPKAGASPAGAIRWSLLPGGENQ